MMPTVRIPFGEGHAIVTYQEDWKKGDLPPKDRSDYLAMHAWADAQHKGGLRQKQCGGCGAWFYPQEMSGKVVEKSGWRDKKMTKPVKWTEPLCASCGDSHA